MLKREIKQLGHILYHLERANKFIQRNDVLVTTQQCPSTISYYNADGIGITPITKDIGSDLCGLYQAIDLIKSLINPKHSEENGNE